ncbi:hypothetical protein ACHAW6_002365 [Cyclotella cf. meneghiniana]
MNDLEFIKEYRCSSSVPCIDKIEINDIFKRGTRGDAQIPVKNQPIPLLHFMGKQGKSYASQ